MGSLGKKLIKFIYRLKPFNRRLFSRFEPPRMIECKCVYLNGGQEQESLSEIVNVSWGGILLLTNEKKIYPKTDVEIRVQLPFESEIISLRGFIVWTHRKHEQSWYYSGVQLHDPRQKGVETLLRFITGEKEVGNA